MAKNFEKKLRFKAKNLPLKKKKKRDNSGQNKQAGAELKNKKRLFWAKIVKKKLSLKAKNCPILKKEKKKDI